MKRILNDKDFTKNKNIQNVMNAFTAPITEKEIEALRKELTINGFKHTISATRVFLGEISDLGMTQEERLYWEKVSLSL